MSDVTTDLTGIRNVVRRRAAITRRKADATLSNKYRPVSETFLRRKCIANIPSQVQKSEAQIHAA